MSWTGLSHTPIWYCENPQLLELAEWIRFWVAYQAEELDRVCYASCQLMPHDTQKFHSSLGSLGSTLPDSKWGAKVAWGSLCRPLPCATECRCHSESLGGTQSGPAGPTGRFMADCRCWVELYQVPRKMLKLHSWVRFTVQAFSSCHWAQAAPRPLKVAGQSLAPRDLMWLKEKHLWGITVPITELCAVIPWELGRFM